MSLIYLPRLEEFRPLPIFSWENCPHVMPQTLPKGYAHVIKENIPLHMGLVEQYELWSKRDPMTAELMIEY